MKTLSQCPACGSQELLPVDFPTDLKESEIREFSGVVAADSDFALCARCELLFARKRQDASDTVAYYDTFTTIEKRDYAVYPPPQEFLDAQARLSEFLLGLLESAGVLQGRSSVLNIRSECGLHLAGLRDRYGFSELYGLDHFESNFRYAREDLGISHMAELHPFSPAVPFERKRFDLVLCNHMVTHALEPMKLLAWFRELLEDGGVVVLYNEIDHLPRFYEGSLYKKGVVNFHKQLLTQKSLDNLCRLGGFDTEFLACNPEKIRWASNRGSMVFLLRPSQPLAVEALPPADTGAVLEAIAAGRERHRAERERKARRAQSIPLYRTAISIKRWLRRRA